MTNKEINIAKKRMSDLERDPKAHLGSSFSDELKKRLDEDKEFRLLYVKEIIESEIEIAIKEFNEEYGYKICGKAENIKVWEKK